LGEVGCLSSHPTAKPAAFERIGLFVSPIYCKTRALGRTNYGMAPPSRDLVALVVYAKAYLPLSSFGGQLQYRVNLPLLLPLYRSRRRSRQRTSSWRRQCSCRLCCRSRRRLARARILCLVGLWILGPEPPRCAVPQLLCITAASVPFVGVVYFANVGSIANGIEIMMVAMATMKDPFFSCRMELAGYSLRCCNRLRGCYRSCCDRAGGRGRCYRLRGCYCYRSCWLWGRCLARARILCLVGL